MLQAFAITPRSYDAQTNCATFDVALSSGTPATTHTLDTQALLEQYPDLLRHRCDSGHHRSFATEMKQTETVHLLEHLAVELLVQSGVSRDRAHGKTGIPKDGSPAYRLCLYGGSSLEEMDALLRKAATILQAL